MSEPTVSLFGDDFACLAMDPPWLERGGGQCKRVADRHYPLMPVDQILKVILAAPEWRPAESAHLWMWVTDNFLEDGLWLIRALGFRYIRTFPWVKLRREIRGDARLTDLCELASAGLQIGLGQYARGAHELLLLAVRGEAMVPPPDRRPPSVIFAPRTEHSRKPLAAYQLIERVSPGPRVEFFARSPREGWTVAGNQSTGETRFCTACGTRMVRLEVQEGEVWGCHRCGEQVDT